MDKALFARLTASMAEMGEIADGVRKPSRTFEIDAMKIKEIRSASGLSQTRPCATVSRVGARPLAPLKRCCGQLLTIHSTLSRRYRAEFAAVFRRCGMRAAKTAISLFFSFSSGYSQV